MFKKCMNNYFKDLKYVFTVLGIMFLAFLIGISFFTKRTNADITTMVNAISTITQSTNFALFKVEGGFSQVLRNYGSFLGGVFEQLLTAFVNLIAGISIFISIQLAGIYVSNLVVFLFGRYDINHDNIFKVCLEQLCRSCLVFCIWAIITATFIWIHPYAGAALVILYPLGYCFIALLSAWLTSGKKNRPMWTQYVTFKNILVLFAANIVQIIITIIVGAIAFAVFDALAAVIICIGLFIVIGAATNLNAYAVLYEEDYDLAAAGRTKRIEENKNDTPS